MNGDLRPVNADVDAGVTSSGPTIVYVFPEPTCPKATTVKFSPSGHTPQPTHVGQWLLQPVWQAMGQSARSTRSTCFSSAAKTLC